MSSRCRGAESIGRLAVGPLAHCIGGADHKAKARGGLAVPGREGEKALRRRVEQGGAPDERMECCVQRTVLPACLAQGLPSRQTPQAIPLPSQVACAVLTLMVPATGPPSVPPTVKLTPPAAGTATTS